MKLALVHDWLNQYGGAERVLDQWLRFFPDAPLYTSMYWRAGMPTSYRARDIRTTWMNHLPGIYRYHQAYFPLYALAFARLDLRHKFDVVLSNKSGFCHGVRTGDTPHLCYCLAPTRYVWEYETYAARERLPKSFKETLKPFITLLRRWDYQAAQRPTTHFIAISSEIQTRIRRYYHREAKIIPPPVDVRRFHPRPQHEAYYLIVSRLVPYKRIDLAIQAFNELGLPLWIAGAGRDRTALEAMARPNITFLGRVPDETLPELFAKCKAFVFPGREDFGITPVEAQASGRPVIAYGAGGALDTVIPGVTGTFFYQATASSIKEAVASFDADAVDPATCRANAARFSTEKHQQALYAEIARVASS